MSHLVGAEALDIQPFSYDYYRRMLESAMDQDYRLSSFADYDPSFKKSVIVRHDIDYTLVGTLKLAEVERDLGVTATYLFRVHAHEYNLYSHFAHHLLKQLLDMGHEIGLHFEAMTFARATGLNPEDILRSEKQVLETILGQPVISCSEHRDQSHVIHDTPYFHIEHDPLEAGFRYFSMAPEYFSEMKYLSDSNGNWREGDLIQHLGKHDRFQILTHPEWWFDEDLLVKAPYFHGLGRS